MYLTLTRASRALPRSRVINGDTLFNDVLFNDVLDGFFIDARNTPASAVAPPALAARFDVIEKEDGFEARIEIPGVSKEDIDVQIDGAVVRINAAPKEVGPAAEGDRVLHSNRATRSWSRNFTLPVEVAEDRAEAIYENGVLTLTLPKKAVVKPKRLAIK